MRKYERRGRRGVRGMRMDIRRRRGVYNRNEEGENE
jgi:hypothetical protein